MALPDNKFLGKEEIFSVFYHNIFDYPLSAKEIIKWRVGKKGVPLFESTKEISNKDGIYFLKGRENLLYKRSLRKRSSTRKIEIVKKNASVLARFSGVKGIFVTGALSMNNADEESDIDLMIITKKNRLWTTRLFVYIILKILKSAVRKPDDKGQKDKLCLNIWIDEGSLVWDKKDRNIYSAHEIAQTVPIVDKDGIYQSFLLKNTWILDYWPNSIRINKKINRSKSKAKKAGLIEKACFWIQYMYMESRITREKISRHRAIFHPNDWGKLVLEKLSS